MASHLSAWISSAFVLSMAFTAGLSCDFSRWKGTWFQINEDLVRINGNDISSKGRCIESAGENYIFTNSVNGRRGFRCLTIIEKHINLLQYKELVIDSLNMTSACSQMSEDLPVFFMIKVNATPIVCPWKGSFNFTYNNGFGECQSPVSSIDTCMEDSKLLIRFQACPDVQKTESKVVELTCWASWSEGSSNFVLGQLQHTRSKPNDDTFRCYVYEEISPNQVNVAQSADVTCKGVASPTEGSRTMKLLKVNQNNTCQYPEWMDHSSSWHSVDNPTEYVLRFKKHTLSVFTDGSEKPTRKLECRFVAEKGENVAAYVARLIQGCQSSFICILFERQTNNNVIMQLGTINHSRLDACERYFDRKFSERVTLVDFEHRFPPTCGSPAKETDETKALSASELQRLVLLEQLSLLRMQKEALCRETTSSTPIQILNTTVLL